MDVKFTTYIPWKPLQVEWEGKKQTIHSKIRFTSKSVQLVVVHDLVRVWNCACDEDQVGADAKRFNSGVDHSVPFTLELLQHLLFKTKHTHHRHTIGRVKYDDDDEDEDEAMSGHERDEGALTFLMKSEMKIGEVYKFNWTFRLIPLGSLLEQSQFIRDHLLLPYTALTRDLTLKLPMASAYDRRIAQETLDDLGSYHDTCGVFTIPKSLESLYEEQARKLFPNIAEPSDPADVVGYRLRTKKKKSAEELDAELAELEAKHDHGAPLAGAAAVTDFDDLDLTMDGGGDGGGPLAAVSVVASPGSAEAKPPSKKERKKKKRKKFV